MLPDTPDVVEVVVGARPGARPRLARDRHELDRPGARRASSPPRSPRAGVVDARRAGERRTEGRDRRGALDHGGRRRRRLRPRRADPAADGRERRPRGALGGRPGHEGVQPARRRRHDRGGRRGVAAGRALRRRRRRRSARRCSAGSPARRSSRSTASGCSTATFDPGFRIRLHRKDARIVEDAAAGARVADPVVRGGRRAVPARGRRRRRRPRPLGAVPRARPGGVQPGSAAASGVGAARAQRSAQTCSSPSTAASSSPRGVSA